MNNYVDYQVYIKEKLYFALKLIISIFLYGLAVAFIAIKYEAGFVSLIYAVLYYLLFIFLSLFIYKGLLLGYLRGNALKVTAKQFPEIREVVIDQTRKLQLKRVPDVFVLQSGGLLNAFASQFAGKNYIVLYSDIVEEAYENNKEAVDFIIGHELGHIKRKHLSKNIFLFPSAIIPFLQQAYSRACEYTCDNIGAELAAKGVRNGLFLLAAGKKLYRRVELEAVLEQMQNESGFWPWFAEKVSTHPRLIKRIARFNDVKYMQLKVGTKIKTEIETKDHSKYMPTV